MSAKFDRHTVRRCAGALSVTTLLALTAFAARVDAATLSVPAGGDLQGAIDAAQPGDVILLAPGATYVGTFTLGVKAGNSFITIRTDAPPDAVPPPNVRMSPAYAAALAKIVPPNTSSAAMVAANGAHHWRLELVEFAGNGGSDLIVLGNGTQTQESQLPRDFVFDRVYIHGDPVRGQKRGIALNGGSTHVLNSYISDIKAVGIDTQALCGWNGSGPFVIENNYLEAAGENVMFGGADPSIANLVPSDITVRRNVLSKPLAWRQEKWTVKNAFELKNARRVLVEGNIIENVWAQAQTGIAVLLTTRNQGGKAPWSTVEDVTIRYNIVRHAGGAFNISGFDDLRPSAQGQRLMIADNLVYDIDGSRWGGQGRFLTIGNQPRDITFERNTVVHTGNLVTAYGRPIEGFVFRNNMARHNSFGVIGDGQSPGINTLNTYFPGAAFDRNVLAGGKASTYPSGNYFPTVAEFEESFASPLTENFMPAAASSLRLSLSADGPVGADVSAVSRAVEGFGAPVFIPVRGINDYPDKDDRTETDYAPVQ